MKIKSVARPAIVLVLTVLLASSAQARALYEPPAGRALLVVGQDLGAIGGFSSPNNNGYVNHIAPVPGGVTTYLGLPSLSGMTSQTNWGAGDINGQAILDNSTYDNSALVIGLSMVGYEETIAGGSTYQDNRIKTLARWIKGANRPVFLRIGYEFDGSWNAYDAESFKTAWQRIVQIFRDEGVDNCAMVWQSCASPYSTYKNRDLLEWYPGDEWVDWCGYSWFLGGTSEQVQLVDKIVNIARARGKPVMVCESTPQGYDLTNLTLSSLGDGTNPQSKTPQQIWDGWFTPFFDYIRENDDVVRAVAYINVNWDSQDMWDSPYEQGYWGDSRVQANATIETLWRQTVLGGGWLHASPELFSALSTGEDANLPDAPGNLSGSLVTDTSVELQWETPSAQELVGGYQIYWSTDSVRPPAPGVTLPAYATAYTVTELDPCTHYTFWVFSDNTAGESPPATVAVATPFTYAGWAAKTMPDIPETDREVQADPDGDKLVNLLEYALGSDPLASSRLADPAVLVVEQDNQHYLRFTYRRMSGGTGGTVTGYSVGGVLYQVETSADLQADTWQSGSDWFEPMGAPLDLGDGYETAAVQLRLSLEASSPRFLRLNITDETTVASATVTGPSLSASIIQ